LLLGWCVLLMPFTFSRAGVLNLLILIILSVVFFRPRKDEAGSPGFRNPERKRGLRWVRGALVTILLIAILAGLIYLVGTQNPFFARIWAYWGQEQVSLTGYLSYLGFDARLIYSQAAANTFRAYPLLGVGLGNYAFYFEEMLPYRPLAEVPEVLKVVTPESGRARLITAKNFYLRLMAETGMLGTITFLSFLIAMLGCALFLWLTPQEEMRFWGSASLIGLIAFMLSTLTFDSFVIPNMWVLFGLITAATRITYNARPG
jgi:O-antigen ligase